MVKSTTVIGVAGAALMVFAILQMFQFRKFKQEVDANAKLPMDVVVQTLLALVMSVYAAIAQTGAIKPLFAYCEYTSKTMETTLHTPDMMLYSHRGGAVAEFKRRAANKS